MEKGDHKAEYAPDLDDGGGSIIFGISLYAAARSSGRTGA